ncbi:Inner membrane protein translocase and chaperone YidC, long form [hydrothermal vent metagenome]|uniref:Membrane protein insertase YidC n=1 Tax=hydrothermal vent metagenome TaxID=652676 RepID=A0A3B0QNW4_9ZZZZ
MKNDKRTIILLALTIVILFGYPYVMKFLFPPTPEEIARQAEKQVKNEAEATAEKTGIKKPVVMKKYSTTLVKPSEKEEFITVETPLYSAVISSWGGGVKSWKLKKYRKTRDPESPLIDLTPVLHEKNVLRPLISRLEMDGAPSIIPFTASKKAIILEAGKVKTLRLRWKGLGGVILEKDYTFNADNYGVKTVVNIVNKTKAPIDGRFVTDITGFYKKLGKKAKKGRYNFHKGPVIKGTGKVERPKITEPGSESGGGPVAWIGLEDKYFLKALVPPFVAKEKKSQAEDDDEAVAEPATSNLLWTSNIKEDEYSSATLASVSLAEKLELAPGATSTIEYTAFMGAKDYNLLKKTGNKLEDAIEFGYFSIIAKPCLVLLNFFNKYVNNYGIAIIILTVLFKIIFYPLTKYGLKSMKNMQTMQPQMKAIKEKYKDDKSAQNKATMELYKRNKINPMGGCLPMVLQIPVFIGLYEVLAVAIELRHAPFALWLVDLSAKDPYYITPVLMGISMFLHQKMTPSAMDPMQSKMMMIMPVVMTFLFLNFPSGLVLYWLVNNILSILQQWQVSRSAGTPTGGGGEKGVGKNKKGGKVKKRFALPGFKMLKA